MVSTGGLKQPEWSPCTEQSTAVKNYLAETGAAEYPGGEMGMAEAVSSIDPG